MPWDGMVEDDEHTQIIGGLGSLIGQAWIDKRRVDCLQGRSIEIQSTDAAISLEKVRTAEGQYVYRRVGSLCHHLKKVKDGEEERKEGMARADGSRDATGVVEKSVVSWTLEVHFPDCTRARAEIVQEKEVLR